MTETRTAVPSWVTGAVIAGLVAGGLGWLTDYRPFAAAAAVLLIAAGIGGLAAVVRPPKPTAPQPIPGLDPQSGSLVGVRIRHRGGISTVTEDLDCPQPRRTVDAVDGHGRPERLMVGVDADGRVVEAAAPGADWAAAEAV
jgi:hypothetical protein